MKNSTDEYRHRRDVFPFAAVLKQDKIKQALLWNLVNPAIGGVLISGEKGTAKSTLVRGLEDLSNSMRIVELPLNVTEDRLIGSIDLKQAILSGQRTMEAGILQKADGNILYIDEVNLLSEYIVSDLLSVTGSGIIVVERDGLSTRHATSFILIGSMNPEEGKLGPQLLDRFGLYVEAESEKVTVDRMEIMRRRLEYERDCVAFRAHFAEDTRALKKKIQTAIEFLPKVKVTEHSMQLAATLSSQACCAGHRAELVILQTARAIAALDGRTMLNRQDLQIAASYALPHRARSLQQEIQEFPPEGQEEPPDNSQPPEGNQQQEPPTQGRMEESPSPPEQGHGGSGGAEPSDPAGETSAPIEQKGSEKMVGADSYQPDSHSDPDEDTEEDVQFPDDAILISRWETGIVTAQTNSGSGRRNRVRSETNQGRYVRYRVAGEHEKIHDLAFDATVRAAAPLQSSRDRGSRAIAIEPGDIRVKIRERRTGGYILFVVDASASMGVNQRMSAVKGAVLSMLNLSYQKRDQVALIAFRKDQAQLLLNFTRSVELAQKQLEILPTGGKTPLGKGLDLAYQTVMGLKLRDKNADPTIVLVSDGRASGDSRNGKPFTQALQAAQRIGNQNIDTVILDTEQSFVRLHLCEKLNEKMHGTVVTMGELYSNGIVQAVKFTRGRQR